MQYQLVVQFQTASKEDFDRLIRFEQSLSAALDGSAMVDGHDFGSGEFNIFVLTDSPTGTFKQVRNTFALESMPKEMRVAYRKLDANDYTVLWPPHLKEFKVV